MLTDTVIHRTEDRVSAYIKQYVKLVGIEKKEEVLELFDSILQIFPHWAIMTCPVMHPYLNYVSDNCHELFGHNNETFVNNNRVNRYFEMVHDADKEDLFRCFSFLHDYLETIPPEQHFQYRSIMYYRFKKQNGQFIHLHAEKATLNFTGSGNLYFGLFRNISEEKQFSGVKIEIFKQQRSNVKIAEFKPSAERTMLTKREGELVTLFKQGLSTKEIAWYLKISHNTVRNIKSKLFEKYNVNNTIELLNVTA